LFLSAPSLIPPLSLHDALPILLPLVVIVPVFIFSRKRISWKEDLGFVRPEASAVLLWLAIWIVWMIITEMAIQALGMEQAKHWRSEEHTSELQSRGHLVWRLVV